jgi:hypothetical protein
MMHKTVQQQGESTLAEAKAMFREQCQAWRAALVRLTGYDPARDGIDPDEENAWSQREATEAAWMDEEQARADRV